MANAYDIGDTVVLSARFQQSGIDIDPTTVSLTVLFPNDTSVTYTYPATITKDSVGHYHVDQAVSQAGIHRFRWTSTGTGQSSEENVFEGRQRLVP